MISQARTLVAGLVMTSVLVLTPVASAAAAPLPVAPVASVEAQVIGQGGLIDVAVGNVNVLNNANVGVAAQVAANICGVAVGPVAVLANQVARQGGQQTVCNTAQGPVTISHA